MNQLRNVILIVLTIYIRIEVCVCSQIRFSIVSIHDLFINSSSSVINRNMLRGFLG